MSLQGKLIVITRSASGSKEWEKYLKKHGATVYNFPTIQMSPITPSDELVKKLSHINEFDWVVFTSANGVRYLQTIADKIGLKLSNFELPVVAAIGKKTAEVAKKAGFTVNFQPARADSATLGSELRPTEGKKILLLRTTLASNELAKQLTDRGGVVTDLPIYQTEPISKQSLEFSKLLQEDKVDFITFSSPSAVQGFSQRLNTVDFVKAKLLPVVAIGPSVVEALKELGFYNINVAQEPTPEGVTETLRHLT